jgi:hypothetical protein
MEVVDEVADLFTQEKPTVCAEQDTLADTRQGRLDAAGPSPSVHSLSAILPKFLGALCVHSEVGLVHTGCTFAMSTLAVTGEKNTLKKKPSVHSFWIVLHIVHTGHDFKNNIKCAHTLDSFT